MALYQKSVLKKYIKQLETIKVDKAYKKYTNHFLNPTIQENIRNYKEEEYQGIFLTDLFVTILEYTLKPNPNFNLVAEYKNQTNSRKADGAILFNDKAIGVIELKGTNTKDLESIRKQAFDYKANQKECVYVITSNYEKLRFYINDATEFEEFNLFELSKEQFKLLYLCLHKDHIENNIPLKIKEASLLEEEQITKKFYKDYSVFKRELHRDLVKRNVKRIKTNSVTSSGVEKLNEAALDKETKAELFKLEKNVKLNLFKKSQKLIDRFLFVFFAEDRGLLPPNSTLQILNKWKADVDFGDDRPLYDMFKQYFKFLDTGRQGTTNRAEIYAYNGGLFKEDVVLDQLEIDNDLLYNHTKTLAAYDFESQVDVNILGHIFENSLNEIESVNAEIEGGYFDKQKSKRKKDGVFYTPKYITKYIVENTIAKLCEEKKNELGFKEEEYFKGRKNRNKTTIEKLVETLDTYRNWLLQLTICDPACGSGAFLNQALEFLIKEHNYIDELKAKILGGGLVFSDIENTILENNIYGVDLNEESVEIAKLSLWLRTAQPRRKLNNLNSNIKCGNSLIDSKAVAGDKAFNWHEQFPTVFKEKNKKTWHITTAIHDSRTSQQMIDYKVREKRDMGTNPYPQVIPFTAKEEALITKTVADIVAQDKLLVLAFNVCKDHMHITFVCEEEEVQKIVQKIKAITARTVNSERGVTTPALSSSLASPTLSSSPALSSMKHAPLSESIAESILVEHSEVPSSPSLSSTLSSTLSSMEHAPLSEDIPESIAGNIAKKTRGEKQNSLWTQKYHCNEITSPEQLQNTIEYIKNNRTKHELPPHDKATKLLIENMLCTQKEAFKTEYKGGFDVIIGNPPYVQLQKMKEVSEKIKTLGYKTYESTGDLYCLFYEKGNQILKDNGLLGFITSNKWMRANYGKSLRNYFLKETTPYKLLDLGSGIFEAAVVDSNIILTRKLKTLNISIPSIDLSNEINVVDFSIYNDLYVSIQPKNDEVWTISSKAEQSLKQKFDKKGTPLKDWDLKFNRGILTGYNDAFIIDNATKEGLIHLDSTSIHLIKPILAGKDIQRYKIDFNNLYIITTFPSLKIEIDNFPTLKDYFKNFGKKIYQIGEFYINEIGVKDKTRKKTSNKWFVTQDTISYHKEYLLPKIFYREISDDMNAVYREHEIYTNNKAYIITGESLKYLCCFLNSKLFNKMVLSQTSNLGGKGESFMKEVPVPKINNDERIHFIEKADIILSLNKELQEKNTKLTSYLQGQFQLEKLSKKLENWYDLSFSEFIKEVNKAIKTNNKELVKNNLQPIKELTKLDEMDWMDVFETKKAEAQNLKQQINTTDKKIDSMVYELYGLSEEEIKIVENS